jgi:hypothetical protein
MFSDEFKIINRYVRNDLITVTGIALLYGRKAKSFDDFEQGLPVGYPEL